MSIEVYRKNITTSCGEGPHWDARTNTLLFMDIGSGDAHRLHYTTGQDEIKHFGTDNIVVLPGQKLGL